jgi:hypothetical protein
MAWHHIIPKHEWKRRFGNLQGLNTPDNLVNLTTEQHAQVHSHYFDEITHIELDRVASLAISGLIGKEEARIKSASLVNSTRIHSERSKRDHSIFITGNKNAVGFKHTEQWKQEQSQRKKGLLVGYKHPKEFGESISARMVGMPQLRVECPFCHKIGTSGPLHRWHFDNCKEKK